MAILTELRDPRVRDVTVTYVEVSPDMRHAKVHVSVMGDDKQQQLTLRGLENAAGFLQQRVNQRIETRYTPRLKFVLDQGVKHSLEVARILDEVLPREAPAGPDDGVSDENDHSAEHETPGQDSGGQDAGEQVESAEHDASAEAAQKQESDQRES